MRAKRRLPARGSIAVLLLLLIVPLSMTTAVCSDNKVEPRKIVGWYLDHAKVVRNGQAVKTSIGSLGSGCVVEATATAIGDAPIETGRFRIIYTAFSHSKRIDNTESSQWHISGDWTITATGGRSRARGSRNGSAVLKGSLSSLLLFNPMASKGTIKATISVPMSRTGKKRLMGDGTFYGNDRFEGQMFLALDRWDEED
jgi:hypothetical protein